MKTNFGIVLPTHGILFSQCTGTYHRRATMLCQNRLDFHPFSPSSPVKEWAKRYTSPDNELRDAILMERDSMSRIEVAMKIAAYNNMLDAKARRMKRGNVT